jgi:hypothetical protein
MTTNNNLSSIIRELNLSTSSYFKNNKTIFDSSFPDEEYSSPDNYSDEDIQNRNDYDYPDEPGFVYDQRNHYNNSEEDKENRDQPGFVYDQRNDYSEEDKENRNQPGFVYDQRNDYNYCNEIEEKLKETTQIEKILSRKNTTSGENCSICFESMMNKNISIPFCLHKFCSECLKEWLKQKNTCPICRNKI